MRVERESTYGLTLDQMAGLFAMGADDPDPAAGRAGDEALRDLLHEQLTRTDPKRSVLRDALVMMIASSGTDAGALANRPLGEILLNPQSDLGLLRAIKECSKTLSGNLDSRTEAALARTVYFTAIAAALVHHDAKITQNSCETLAESLTILMGKRWMAPQLARLFSQARQVCQSRSNET